MKQSAKGVIYLLIILMGIPQIMYAQQEKKKMINASFNIGRSTGDSAQFTSVNLGLLTNIYQLKGVGINVVSSIVKNKVTGFQLAGISNIAGNNMTGLQIAGITNVDGNNASGLTLSGLVNIIGQNTCGAVFTAGVNVIGSHADGLTFGGLLNTVAGQTNGLQLSGIANITGETNSGVSLAGLLNVTGSNLFGVQVSSLLNVTGDQVCGIQLSGLGNVGVNVKGLQIAGLGNFAAEDLRGIQISPLTNIAKQVKGAQIGIVNYSMGKVRGLQLGLVNYSKDSSRVKLGLVNINPETRTQLMVFGGNTTKVNLGVRFLNKITYTMLGAGAQYLGLNEKFSLTTFYRAGLHFSPIKRLRLSGDLGFAHIECFKNKELADIPARLYSLQARINLEYYPVERFGLFASGGFGHTRFYNRNKTFGNKPIIELGIILF